MPANPAPKTSEPSASVRAAVAFALACATSFAVASSGCVSMDVPERFSVVSSGLSELKAMSPDDSRIWVREFDEPHDADLAFWAETVRNDFVLNRGYTLLEEEPVKDADGDDGRLYTFEVTAGGVPRRYLIVVYHVDDWPADDIVTVEYAATREAFERDVGAVRKALATLSP